MNTEAKTKVEGIRLPVAHWTKLRALIQAKGRPWLEKLIDRETKKLDASQQKEKA